MREEIYEHLPRWRRILRGLAIEAGLKEFIEPADQEANHTKSDLESSASENEVDHANGPVHSPRRTDAETRSKCRRK